MVAGGSYLKNKETNPFLFFLIFNLFLNAIKANSICTCFNFMTIYLKMVTTWKGCQSVGCQGYRGDDKQFAALEVE